MLALELGLGLDLPGLGLLLLLDPSCLGLLSLLESRPLRLGSLRPCWLSRSASLPRLSLSSLLSVAPRRLGLLSRHKVHKPSQQRSNDVYVVMAHGRLLCSIGLPAPRCVAYTAATLLGLHLALDSMAQAAHLSSSRSLSPSLSLSLSVSRTLLLRRLLSRSSMDSYSRCCSLWNEVYLQECSHMARLRSAHCLIHPSSQR